MLVKGDVALSVTLTALSSIITLFTLPFIMEAVSVYLSAHSGVSVNLPVSKLLMQNIVLLLIPMLLGIALRRLRPAVAEKVNKVLGKAAFPALMFLAFVFFLQYTSEIIENFTLLGVAVTVLILGALLCSSLLSRVGGFGDAVRRTIVIEVGMQNAGLATVLSVKHFPAMPEAAIASAVSCVWHSVSGALLAGVFNFFDGLSSRLQSKRGRRFA
jgi:BASS family bile acid:Na+ symporter